MGSDSICLVIASPVLLDSRTGVAIQMDCFVVPADWDSSQ
jgi:hypothetical protein